MSRYDDLYYGIDNSLSSERTTKKTGKSSTRKKSTEPATENGIISNAVCVKVRETPDPGAKVTAVANAKEKVEILDADGQYYRIKLSSGDVGYILSKFCEKG